MGDQARDEEHNPQKSYFRDLSPQPHHPDGASPMVVSGIKIYHRQKTKIHERKAREQGFLRPIIEIGISVEVRANPFRHVT